MTEGKPMRDPRMLELVPAAREGAAAESSPNCTLADVGVGSDDSSRSDNSDQIWDAQLPAMPPRSSLYPLLPAGIATGEVESITSYVARLATAHTVSTWALLRGKIGPRLFECDTVLRYRLGELVATTGAAFNGENATSRALVSVLQPLTGRNDLDRLTMGFCSGFVCSRFLVRVKQRWCSDCLAEWRMKGRLVYWPLLWQVMAVNVCPGHGNPLQEECPHCGRTCFPLSAHSRPGWCSNCGEWLGATDLNQNPSTPSPEVEQEIATRISDFLRTGHGLLAARGSTAFPKNVELLRECHFGGNVAALSRFLALNRYTILGWERATQSPRLLLLADLSRKVKVPMEALLAKELQPADFSVEAGANRHLIRKRSAAPPPLDLVRARRLLEEAASDDRNAPLSLTKVAAQLRCRTKTLLQRFPDLVNRIKDRYRDACCVRKRVRAEHIRSIVRRATLDIHRAGDYPSQCRVRQLLPKSIDMRDPTALQEWKQTLGELELGHDPGARLAPGEGC